MTLKCVLDAPRTYFSLICIILIFFNLWRFDFTNGAISSSSSESWSADPLYEANHNVPYTIKSKSHFQVLGRFNGTGNSVVFKGLVAAIAVIGISLLIVKCIRSIQRDAGKKLIRRLSNNAEDCPVAGAASDPAPPPLTGEFHNVVHKLLDSLISIYNIGREYPASFITIKRKLCRNADKWEHEILEECTTLARHKADGTVTADIHRHVRRERLHLLKRFVKPHLEGGNPELLKMIAGQIARVLYIVPEAYEAELKNLREILLHLDGTEEWHLDDDGVGKVLTLLRSKAIVDLTIEEKNLHDILTVTVPLVLRFNNLIRGHLVVLGEAMYKLSLTDKEMHVDMMERTAQEDRALIENVIKNDKIDT